MLWQIATRTEYYDHLFDDERDAYFDSLRTLCGRIETSVLVVLEDQDDRVLCPVCAALAKQDRLFEVGS